METFDSVNITQNDKIISSINTILQEIINENQDLSKKSIMESQKESPFYTKRVPSISVLNYLERILKYTKMEESTLILMLIYIDRLCEKNNFLLSENNIHR